MKYEYELEFTHAALVKMAARGIRKEDIESRVRNEMESMCDIENTADPECHISPPDFMMHVVMTNHNGEELIWLAKGDDEKKVTVTSATFQEVPMPEEGNFAPGGPFHGKKVMMPVADDE